MNESDDSPDGGRAPQDRRWWRSPRAAFVAWKARRCVAFVEWKARRRTARVERKEHQREADERRNRRADEKWEIHGRRRIFWAILGGLVLAFLPVIPVVREALSLEAWGGLPFATFLVATVGASMAMWRARQFKKSLEQSRDQAQATEFANYLKMAAGDSVSTARAGFAGLGGMLPDLSERQLKAVFPLILSALSLKKSFYEEIRLQFNTQVGEMPLEEAIRGVYDHVRQERPAIFRREVLAFWFDYTKARMKRSYGINVDEKKMGRLLFSEEEYIHNLNLSLFDLRRVRPVTVLHEGNGSFRINDISFTKCLFAGTDFGSGAGLTFDDCICVKGTFLPIHFSAIQSPDIRDRYRFFSTALCASEVQVSPSTKFFFIRTNITNVEFREVEGEVEEMKDEVINADTLPPRLDALFWDNVVPFARSLNFKRRLDRETKVYWVVPHGVEGVVEGVYAPKFCMKHSDGYATSPEMVHFLRETRYNSVPIPPRSLMMADY